MTKSYRMLLMGAALTLLLSCASCDKAQNTVTSPAQNELLHESHSQNEPLQESPAQNEPLHDFPSVNKGEIEKRTVELLRSSTKRVDIPKIITQEFGKSISRAQVYKIRKKYLSRSIEEGERLPEANGKKN